jgi:hypothetical protein
MVFTSPSVEVIGSCPKKGNTTPITWSAQGPPGPPGASVTPIFAKLDITNRQVIASSHATAVAFSTEQVVTFDRDVSKCAVTPTVSNDNVSVGDPQAYVVNTNGASVTLYASGPGQLSDPLVLDVVATCAS